MPENIRGILLYKLISGMRFFRDRRISAFSGPKPSFLRSMQIPGDLKMHIGGVGGHNFPLFLSAPTLIPVICGIRAGTVLVKRAPGSLITQLWTTGLGKPVVTLYKMLRIRCAYSIPDPYMHRDLS